ncbi:ABC transporter substrate-binding protein [Rhizobium sp. SL86]|uniref:ABC transporter substrate-binding protein n=1 Tax=Rhizobium sp. SL86 TaxID=2995148 RepID=UPI0022736B93|nr:ABC transporter substrate-binding protein [Rhizobium sp. SL86]MCY1666547.1 ABC transporter substrate-binding protein [Rhizobium sp. SL86]
MRITRPNRRQVLKGAAVAFAAPALLRTRSGFAAEPIRIGLVTPSTGPLAFFAQPDAFVIQQFKKAFSEGVGGRPIDLIVKDSQSSASRAAEVASDLILRDEVTLLLSSGGPDTVIPVADQAELNGTPSLSTACPWQSFVMGRGSSPQKGFQNTFLFAFGLEDVIAAYLKLWSGLATNRKVGLLLANDVDGNAWGDASFGFPPALKAAGYEVIDPGRYTPMADDFSAQIAAFQQAGVDIVMGTMIPPEFLSFWSQSAQKGFRPKAATIGKCLLLPATLEALGKGGDRLSTELGWHPAFPFRSATTGETAAEIAAAWQAATGRPWVQTVGYKHALLDLAVDVLKRASDVSDPAAVIAAIRSTDMETTLGPANWSKSPIANVAKAAMMGGQWHWDGAGYGLEIAANPTTLAIPVTRSLQAL